MTRLSSPSHTCRLPTARAAGAWGAFAPAPAGERETRVRWALASDRQPAGQAGRPEVGAAAAA